jgi:hypothetical protein
LRQLPALSVEHQRAAGAAALVERQEQWFVHFFDSLRPPFVRLTLPRAGRSVIRLGPSQRKQARGMP